PWVKTDCRGEAVWRKCPVREINHGCTGSGFSTTTGYFYHAPDASFVFLWPFPSFLSTSATPTELSKHTDGSKYVPRRKQPREPQPPGSPDFCSRCALRLHQHPGPGQQPLLSHQTQLSSLPEDGKQND